MAWLAQRQIGGVTGDVLGATEQVCETAILVLLAAWLA
jgi:adenosylcobinamide-GDP ribazoletransferase